MPNIIDKFSLNLTDAEKAGLNKIIESGNQKQIDNTIDAIIDKFANIEISNELRLQYDKADSKEFNEQFFDFYNDLMTLYLASSKLDAVIETEDSESMSTLNNLKEKIKKIEDYIDIKKMIAMDDNGYVDAFKESFNTKQSIADYDSTLYVDPDSKKRFYEEDICSYNSVNKCITGAIEGTFDGFNIKVKKENQSGESFIEYANKEDNIENMLHGNIYDKWSEVILAPSKIDIQYDDHLYKNIDTDEYISNGAMCTLKFELNTPTPINTISLKPFSKYPFEVVKILSFPNKELHQMFKKENDYKFARKMGQVNEILGPEEFNQIKGPVILDSPRILTFNEVDNVSIIEIVLRQKNYVTSRYNIQQEEKKDIDLIKNITNKKKKLKDTRENKDADSILDLDYYNRRLNWLPFKDMINNIVDLFKGKDNIVDNLIYSLDSYFNKFDSDKFKKYLDNKRKFSNNKKALTRDEFDISGFEYQYGFYNLDILYNSYKQDSIYISNLKNINTNVKEVGLEVSDTLTKTGDINEKEYSIDYYISNLKNPSVNDWHPIIPDNYKDYIQDSSGIKMKEIFYPKINKNGEVYVDLKFAANPDKDIEVYTDKNEKINSILINDNERVLITGFNNSHDFNSINGKFKVMYYIDESKRDPFVIDFDSIANPVSYYDNKGNSGEIFLNGTDKNQQIKLSYYPYIDYEKINNTIIRPENLEVEDETLKQYNPNNYKYNPNYSIQTDDGQYGYRPIIVEMEGQALEYDKNSNEVGIIEDKFYNDKLGIPFNFSYIAEEDNNYVPKEKNREEENLVNGKIKPYFYNKTDYTTGEIPGLLDYDPKENPVFEYTQMGRTINFNDSFNTSGSSNMGRIRVHYSYLVEGIRVMAIMRKLNDNSDITPILNEYIVKTKNFR